MHSFSSLLFKSSRVTVLWLGDSDIRLPLLPPSVSLPTQLEERKSGFQGECSQEENQQFHFAFVFPYIKVAFVFPEQFWELNLPLCGHKRPRVLPQQIAKASG